MFDLTAVAGLLGEGWSGEQTQRGGELHGPDEARIYFNRIGYGVKADMIEVGVSYNLAYNDLPHDMPRPKVNIGSTRTPAAVAKRLQADIMPAYREGLRRQQDKKEYRGRAGAETAQLVAELQAITGDKFRKDGSCYHGSVKVDDGNDHHYASVTINEYSPPSVEIKFYSVRGERAKAILAAFTSR